MRMGGVRVHVVLVEYCGNVEWQLLVQYLYAEIDKHYWGFPKTYKALYHTTLLLGSKSTCTLACNEVCTPLYTRVNHCIQV